MQTRSSQGWLHTVTASSIGAHDLPKEAQGADKAQTPSFRDMGTTLELALKEVLVTAILSL